MTSQSHPSPDYAPVTGATSVPPTLPDARALEQKAQAKARKKQRKLERLLFFFGWCEGCRCYGNSV